MPRQSLMSTLLGHELRNPFGDLDSEFERMIARMRNVPGIATAFDRGERALSPRADIAETDDSVRIEMDLPGVASDDIDVQLVDQALVITGSRHTESERDEDAYHVVERSHGEYRRRVPLGFDVADDAVKADFADGVLTVVIAKPETSRVAPKKIAVNGKPSGAATGSSGERPATARDTTRETGEPA